jgi:hypothetical protein
LAAKAGEQRWHVHRTTAVLSRSCRARRLTCTRCWAGGLRRIPDRCRLQQSRRLAAGTAQCRNVDAKLGSALSLNGTALLWSELLRQRGIANGEIHWSKSSYDFLARRSERVPCWYLPIDHFLEVPDCTITKLPCSLALQARLLGLLVQQPAIQNATILTLPAPL